MKRKCFAETFFWGFSIMKKRALFVSLVTFFLISITFQAKAELTSGADFLKLPQGAALVGISEAGTARYDSPEMIRINPASLGALNYIDVRLSHSSWIFNVNNETLNAVYPLGRGALGLTGQFAIYPKMEVYDTWALPSYTINSPLDMAVSLGYGMTFVDTGIFRVLGGTAAQYTHRTVNEFKSGAVSFDFGATVIYQPLSDIERGLRTGEGEQYLGDIETGDVAVDTTDSGTASTAVSVFRPSYSFGISVKNVGMKLDDDILPLTIRAGLAATFIEGLTVSLDINKAATSSLGLLIGAEYLFLDMFAVRAGINPINLTDGFTAGAGFFRHLGTGKLSIDYAFDPHSGIGIAHHVSIGYSMAPSDNRRNAQEFYYRGINAFIQGDYNEAERMWEKCLKIDPNYTAARERLEELDEAREAQRMLDELEEYQHQHADRFGNR